MLSSEERSGLVFTLVGGGLLVLGLLVAIGFFADPGPGEAARAAGGGPVAPLALGSVRGRAVDARTGFGLVARTIEVRGLEGVSDHWVADADSSSPGAFEVRGLPAARRFTLSIRAAGYVEQAREVEALAARVVDLGDLPLTPLARISGQVVDATGDGLALAQVQLIGSDGRRASVASDALGAFRFEAEPPDLYALTARTIEGEAPLAPLRVDARDGGEIPRLVLEAFPTVSMAGILRMPIGSAPLEGVAADGVRGAIAGDGRFRIDGLRAGPVKLVAIVSETLGIELEEHAPRLDVDLAVDPGAARDVTDALAPARADPVEPDAAQEAAPPARALVVRCVDESGARLPGARIELDDAGDGAARTRFADRSGECAFRRLPAGTWRITARHGEREGALTIDLVDERTHESAVTLAVPAPDRGDESEDVERGDEDGTDEDGASPIEEPAPEERGAGGGEGFVRLEAPEDSPERAVDRVRRASQAGAVAAAAWLGVAWPADAVAPLRWFRSHEAMGLALRAADLVLDDAGIPFVAVTFGSGRSDSIALPDGEEDDRVAARAGACAALRALAPESARAMRAAAAEIASDPGCVAECLALAAALDSIGMLPGAEALADGAPPISPEVGRLLAIATLAAAAPGARRARLDRPEDAPRAELRSALVGASLERRPRPAPGGMQGFCFAHEGYRWVDGYGSGAAWRSLVSARETGATAVALTPFAFQRDAARPGIVALHERGGRGHAPETDAAVAVTAGDARALGLDVVLKPHLWCGHGRWCGEIAMEDEEAWAAWFADLERVVIHWALLARRLRCAAFCLGTELRGTTHRDAEWRALVAKVRALDAPPLTYCANWSEEVAELPFWDALDAIGVSAYWPLADRPGAAESALRARFDEVLAGVERLGRAHRKPVWFLELGFPDVAEPWLAPHRNDGAPDGGADQARAYRIALDAIGARRFPDALFLWKWPSELPQPGRTRHDYWPCGRPAEAILREAWTSAPIPRR